MNLDEKSKIPQRDFLALLENVANIRVTRQTLNNWEGAGLISAPSRIVKAHGGKITSYEPKIFMECYALSGMKKNDDGVSFSNSVIRQAKEDFYSLGIFDDDESKFTFAEGEEIFKKILEENLGYDLLFTTETLTRASALVKYYCLMKESYAILFGKGK